MFAKLLKHEWRATRGVIGLLCVIILIAGLTIGAVMNHIVRAEDAVIVLDESTASSESAMSDWEEVICVLLVMAGVMAVAVCGASSVFVVIYRFYKRCFTDEGYLTFTLPVNNHQILLSSTLNSIFGVLLVMLACIAAVAIAFGLFLIAINHQIIWADVWAAWADVWQQLWQSFLKNSEQFALVGFSAVAGALGELMVLMLSVTIGALLARKHKLLAAVGVYFGIGMVQSILMTIISFNVSAITREDVTTVLASPGIMGLVLTVGSYFLMHYLTGKKLNLT